MFVLQPDESVTLEMEEDVHESLVTPLLPRPAACEETNRPNDSSSSASLAWAATTPWAASLLIPLLIVFNHAVFYYGQTAPMWRLHLSQQIDVWANATSHEARVAFYAAGLANNQHFFRDKEKDIRTFTYGFAIQELWRAKAMHGRFLPRLTSMLLILFSGVWPHLKLFLLNVTWLMPYRAQRVARRTRILRWLSVLGKWSLADILTVCVLLAALDLTWTVDPDTIKHSLVRELPTVLAMVHSIYTPTELCTNLLHYGCEHPSKIAHVTKCRTCTSLFEDSFTHPAWAQTTGKYILNGVETSGGGMAQLSVIGMRGIYAFCAAVILSICLSVTVDVFDNRARRALSSRQHQQEQQQQSLAPNDSVTGAPPRTEGLDVGGLEASEPLLVNHVGIDQANSEEATIRLDAASSRHNWSVACNFVLPVSVATVVALAVMLPTMERKADGAVPTLLYKLIGLDWERLYSFRTLLQTIGGGARGWDLLLMGTFSLFIVAGPIIRSALCVVGLTSPIPQFFRKPLYAAIDFLGAFCAWEVFAIAVVMVEMQMPVITETIIHNRLCGYIAPDGKCLRVQFNILRSFVLVLVGGVLLIQLSAMAIKEGNRGSRQSWSRGEEAPLEQQDLRLSITDKEEEGVMSNMDGINGSHVL